MCALCAGQVVHFAIIRNSSPAVRFEVVDSLIGIPERLRSNFYRLVTNVSRMMMVSLVLFLPYEEDFRADFEWFPYHRVFFQGRLWINTHVACPECSAD